MAKENFSLSAKDFAGTFFFMNVPVVELDTIKASDGNMLSTANHNILWISRVLYTIYCGFIYPK